jgi:hypothetical protein
VPRCMPLAARLLAAGHATAHALNPARCWAMGNVDDVDIEDSACCPRSMLCSSCAEISTTLSASTMYPTPALLSSAQVCGEAVYVDDIKLPADALVAALVTSTRPHARLLAVDPSEALEVPGVTGYYDHR